MYILVLHFIIDHNSFINFKCDNLKINALNVQKCLVLESIYLLK